MLIAEPTSTSPYSRMQAPNAVPCLILAFLSFQGTLSQTLKGFHFNRGLKQLWSLPSDELKDNSSWYFDFDKHGNCARLDVTPFKLPRRFTLCYKQNHDYSDVFTVLSLLASKSGESVIKVLKDNP